MEQPAKQASVTKNRDKDTVPTESKQQDIQARGNVSSGKLNMILKSESLPGSDAESDGNNGSSTSETKSYENHDSLTSETEGNDKNGQAGSEVSSGDNEYSSGSESESTWVSGSDSEPIRWDVMWEGLINCTNGADPWLIWLTPSEQHVFMGLLVAKFCKELPYPIMKIITKLGGGYVVVCEICEEEVHDSEKKPKLPCWCETEALPFCPPLPLCESCSYEKNGSDKPVGIYGFGPWLSCSKCGHTYFNWEIGGDKW